MLLFGTFVLILGAVFVLGQASQIPIVNISSIVAARQIVYRAAYCESVKDAVDQIHHAATTFGFFYVVGHGVSESLQSELAEVSALFFKLPNGVKESIHMNKGGKAWRGFFAVGEEVTSGIPDQKEGIYFGTELATEDSRPLHGKNLWLDDPLGLRMKDVVLTYLAEMKALGQSLMRAVFCRFSVDGDDFQGQFDEPTELFRIFNYPPHDPKFPANSFGVGEHTDYGYLTILKQDNSGGLQVRSLSNQNEWIDAPPVHNSFVVNLGDALEHATSGLYRATPHRVLQRSDASSDRLSMPYFFDPSFDSLMRKFTLLDAETVSESLLLSAQENMARRWDGKDPRQFIGTYGSYLLGKVSKAFPELFKDMIEQQTVRASSEL